MQNETSSTLWWHLQVNQKGIIKEQADYKGGHCATGTGTGATEFPIPVRWTHSFSLSHARLFNKLQTELLPATQSQQLSGESPQPRTKGNKNKSENKPKTVPTVSLAGVVCEESRWAARCRFASMSLNCQQNATNWQKPKKKRKLFVWLAKLEPRKQINGYNNENQRETHKTRNKRKTKAQKGIQRKRSTPRVEQSTQSPEKNPQKTGSSTKICKRLGFYAMCSRQKKGHKRWTGRGEIVFRLEDTLHAMKS